MPRYDDAQFQATKQIYIPAVAANTSWNKFTLVNAAILKNARATVLVAGTSVGTQGGAATGGPTITAGTNTAGVLLQGSDAAGVAMPLVSLGNTVVPAGTPILITKGTDATGTTNIMIEYVDQNV